MQIPRSVLDRYTDAINDAIARGQKAAKMALGEVNYNGPPGEVARQVIAIMDAACGASSQVSARLAADFYDELRRRSVGRAWGAHTFDGRAPVATERAVKAFLKELFEGDVDEFERLCMERIDYEAKAAAGKCVQANVNEDPIGETRFARVPAGDKTCDFCMMLASRGPVYLTEETAGAYDHYHTNCDCRIVPFFGTYEVGRSRRAGVASIEGYDPDALYEEYLALVLDPRKGFAARMSRAADRAKSRAHGEYGLGRGDKWAWGVANAKGLTQFPDIHSVTQYIRDSTSYEDACERIKNVGKEVRFYGLSDTQYGRLLDLCKDVRRVHYEREDIGHHRLERERAYAILTAHRK